MWRSPYLAPPPPQALALDTETLRRAVPTLLQGVPLGNVPPPPWVQPPPVQNTAALQAFTARLAAILPGSVLGAVPPTPWFQPPPVQGVGAILSKLAVTTPLSPPFGATVLGRVEQFYPAWVQPPPVQNYALTALTLRQAVPTLLLSGQPVPLGYLQALYPPWNQPPPVQNPALSTLSTVTAAVTTSLPAPVPFYPRVLGRNDPVAWVQPPTVQSSLSALSKATIVSPFAGPFGATQLPDPIRLLAHYQPWRQPPPLQPDVGRGNSTPTPSTGDGTGGPSRPWHGRDDGVRKKPRWRKIGLDQLREAIDANEVNVAALTGTDASGGPPIFDASEPLLLAALAAQAMILADDEEAILALLLSRPF